MIQAYTLKQADFKQEITSVNQVSELSKKNGWVWIDCTDPNDSEYQLIAELVKRNNIKELVTSKKIRSTYQRVNDYVMIQLMQVDFTEKLDMYPLYLFFNNEVMLTVRTEKTSNPVINSLDTLHGCAQKVTCQTSSSFIISRLFHEVANENLEVIVTLRERICEMEQEALHQSSEKKIDKMVFTLKREIAKFERILWMQRELMIAITEGMIPTIEPSQIDKNAINHTISNLSRELSLISTHSNALDNVLTVRGLGMIHKVETNLVWLTVALVVLTVMLILFELDIIHLIFG